jgi:hypothetical protein
VHGAAPCIRGGDPTPNRQQNIEDPGCAQPKGGDEESDESWQAIRGDNAANEGKEEGGRGKEEECRAPASLVEVPEPWYEERKDSCREG